MIGEGLTNRESCARIISPIIRFRRTSQAFSRNSRAPAAQRRRLSSPGVRAELSARRLAPWAVVWPLEEGPSGPRFAVAIPAS